MHPVSAICEQLARLPKAKLRLAWHGPRNEFAVIQLFHLKDVERDFVGEWEMCNGPIYGKDGRRPDWDPLFWRPMFIGLASDFDCDTHDVMTGHILYEVRQSLEWVAEKKSKSNRKRYRKALMDNADDLGREMADYAWSLGQNTDQTSVDVPWKHARDDVDRMYKRLEQRDRELSGYFGTEA